MERQQKVAILEAIANGNISAIARPLPKLWVKRFAKNELLNEVKKIYGSSAKIIYSKAQPFVIGSQGMPMWFFIDTDEDKIECGSQLFTREEYDSIVSDLQKEGSVWLETKTATRVIHFVRQPGNEPLESDWPADYSQPDTQTGDQPQEVVINNISKTEPQFGPAKYPAVPEGLENWKPIGEPFTFIKPN